MLRCKRAINKLAKFLPLSHVFCVTDVLVLTVMTVVHRLCVSCAVRCCALRATAVNVTLTTWRLARQPLTPRRVARASESFYGQCHRAGAGCDVSVTVWHHCHCMISVVWRQCHCVSSLSLYDQCCVTSVSLCRVNHNVMWILVWYV